MSPLQFRLHQYPVLSKLVTALPHLTTISFAVAVLINVLLLVSVRVSPTAASDLLPLEVCSDSNTTCAAALGEVGVVPFGDEEGLTMYPFGFLSGAYVLLLVRLLAFVHPFLAAVILVVYNVSFAPLIVKARWKERVAVRGNGKASQPPGGSSPAKAKQVTVNELLFSRGPDVAFEALERARHLEALRRGEGGQLGAGPPPTPIEEEEGGESSERLTQRRGATEVAGMDIRTPSKADVALFYCTYCSFCVFDAVRDNSVLYLIGYFIFSCLGYAKNEFFFAYHLGDVVIRNETVKVCVCVSRRCRRPVLPAVSRMSNLHALHPPCSVCMPASVDICKYQCMHLNKMCVYVCVCLPSRCCARWCTTASS